VAAAPWAAEVGPTQHVRGSPLSGHVAKVSDDARAALVSEVGDELTPYVAGDALTFPIKAHLASARKPA